MIFNKNNFYCINKIDKNLLEILTLKKILSLIWKFKTEKNKLNK